MTLRRTLIAIALLVGSAAGAADYPGTIASLQAQARDSNLALRGEALNVRSASAALDQAKAAYRPTISLSARYSRADGGRVQSLPVGDLVNPAYRTLNELLRAQGLPSRFNDIANQEIQFLREREQDTKLSLSQPIYAPAIAASIRAASAGLDAADAGRDAFARRLDRDIEVAYLNYLSAHEAVSIVEASAALLAENQRVNQVLFDNGKVTLDQVLRAKAEVLAVEQQQLEAMNQRELAQSYLNFLLNKPLDSEIARVDVPEPKALADRTLGKLASDLDAANNARFEAQGRSARDELRQLDAATRATQAQVDIERASFLPTVGLAVDAGIQGEDYGFGSGQNYAIASLVLNWTVFDFGARKAAVSAAVARSEAAEIQRQDIANQVALDVRQAADRLRTALRSLDTAAARRAAAQEGFRIASKKRDAGSIAQVEFIDARTALTNAELNDNLTRFSALVRLAELSAALALRQGEPQ